MDQPGFGGLQADVPKCHTHPIYGLLIDGRGGSLVGQDAKGRIVPPPPSLAASVVALLKDNYTLRAAKVCSRLRNGSSVGDALTVECFWVWITGQLSFVGNKIPAGTCTLLIP
jgi:hypothetical protein